MRKIALVKYKIDINFDRDNDLTTIVNETIPVWEEISESDYKVLADNFYQLKKKNILMLELIPMVNTEPEIKKLSISSIIKGIKAKEKSEEERKRKAEETRQKTREEKERKKFELLKQKFEK